MAFLNCGKHLLGVWSAYSPPRRGLEYPVVVLYAGFKGFRESVLYLASHRFVVFGQNPPDVFFQSASLGQHLRLPFRRVGDFSELRNAASHVLQYVGFKLRIGFYQLVGQAVEVAGGKHTLEFAPQNPPCENYPMAQRRVVYGVS